MEGCKHEERCTTYIPFPPSSSLTQPQTHFHFSVSPSTTNTLPLPPYKQPHLQPRLPLEGLNITTATFVRPPSKLCAAATESPTPLCTVSLHMADLLSGSWRKPTPTTIDVLGPRIPTAGEASAEDTAEEVLVTQQRHGMGSTVPVSCWKSICRLLESIWRCTARKPCWPAKHPLEATDTLCRPNVLTILLLVTAYLASTILPIQKISHKSPPDASNAGYRPSRTQYPPPSPGTPAARD